MNKGFTLIEVLIAFVIVAVGLTTILATSSLFTRNSADIRTKIAATIAAQNYLDSLRIQKQTGAPLDVKSTTGTFEQGGMTLPYTLTITPAALPELKNIIVDVKSPDGRSSASTLNAYMVIQDN